MKINFQPRFKPNGTVLLIAYISTGKNTITSQEQIVDVDKFDNPVYDTVQVAKPERVVVTTGISLPGAFWDNKKKQAKKPYQEVNQKLQEFTTYVEQLYKSLVESGIDVKPGLLQSHIKKYVVAAFKKQKKQAKSKHTEPKDKIQVQIPTYFKNEKEEGIRTYLKDYIQKQIDTITNEGYYIHEKGKATVDGYKRFLTNLERFQKATGSKIDLLTLDLDACKRFIQWFVDNGKDIKKLKPGEEQQYKINYINEIKKVLKVFMAMAIGDGIPVPASTKLKDKKEKFFKVRWEKENDPYLTFEELEQIRLLKFDEEQIKKNYDKVRDMFLVGCNSGMSIVDLKQCKHIFNTPKDGWYFSYVRTKKNRGVVLNQKIKVPVRQQYIIDMYLKKYKEEFNFDLSEQKFNKHLPSICLLAGLKRPVEKENKNIKTGATKKTTSKLYLEVSSKTMRKTFASNEAREYKTPLFILKKWTGHSSEAMVLNYIQLSEEDYYQMAMNGNK